MSSSLVAPVSEALDDLKAVAAEYRDPSPAHFHHPNVCTASSSASLVRTAWGEATFSILDYFDAAFRARVNSDDDGIRRSSPPSSSLSRGSLRRAHDTLASSNDRNGNFRFHQAKNHIPAALSCQVQIDIAALGSHRGSFSSFADWFGLFLASNLPGR